MDAEFLSSLASMPAFYGWLPVVPCLVLTFLPGPPDIRADLALRSAARRLQLHGFA
jgi:hypothetical protein